MTAYVGLACIRCGTPPSTEWSFEGCARCAAEGVVSNFECRYDVVELKRLGMPLSLANLVTVGDGIWRFRRLLPITQDTPAISLGEGNTPLLHVARLGEQIGIPSLYIKDESRGPTWSYKDRLASVLVTKAMELRAPGVVVSSTGNHGAAIAAYAARAGLPCIVFTVASAPSVLKIQMQSYGAMVVALERSADRWTLMKQCADALGWMPMSGYVSPPLGSPAFGAEGYKTIAFEIVERWSEVPDFVVVATSYADGLYGVWKGFRELHELGLIDRTPRMVAAESLGSLAATLRARSSAPVDVGRRPTVMFSIGNSIGTFQGLAALDQSGGTAVGTDDESAIGIQMTLARTEGLYAEASAVAGVAAATRLRQEGTIHEPDRVVVVMTSSGLKDPDATAKALPSVPVVEPQLNDLREKLRTAYGFTM